MGASIHLTLGSAWGSDGRAREVSRLEQADRVEKLPYRPPVIRVHGSVAEITRTGNANALEGISTSSQKKSTSLI